ncbi:MULTISPECIES: CsgG/HfaB family protein [unclassified Francisella]|uniref:CsgG/HfaB family protein n=1 Tax=unclassified Francisella TaxID=2610885 RepID=UPI002E30C8BC|nr:MULTISPECIES: CsgG/HfaB family protein [unclassified Francisella]MED7819484.1 CsgG/HfaB family protein [Francisella sp. 19S2-4]MED7830273.1 CsgG/HfaB family protein [Francisella sp. 19S2-10]
MKKALIFLLMPSMFLFSSFTFAESKTSSGSSIVVSGSSVASSGSTASVASGSSTKYKGVDERNDLKMFKVAILPFDAHNAKINANIGIKQLQDGLNNIIIAQITQSRKFRVSNRDAKDQKTYEKEVQRIMNSDTDSEKDKLNKKIGADFILTGDILSLNISKKQTSYYGEKFTSYNVSASVAYRMVELATMEVKWSNVVTIDVPANIANQYVESDNGNYSGLLDYLGKRFGKIISDQIIGAIYPLQVLRVDDGEIYFNQGGDRVIKGNTYEVRQEGGITIDPATGQHTVLDGKVIAKVRITDVMPKYSIGIVIDGSLSKVHRGLRAYLTK